MARLTTKQFNALDDTNRAGLFKVIEDKAMALNRKGLKLAKIIEEVSDELQISRQVVMKYTDLKRFREQYDRKSK